LSREDYVFKIEFINNSKIFPKKVDFNMTIIKIDNTYNLCISIIMDSLVKQVSVNVSQQNGRLFIEDTPTIFIVEPFILQKSSGSIYVTSCLDWKIFGEIIRMGKFPTAIDAYRVEAFAISAYHYRDDVKAMPLNLAYNLDNGFLVHFSGVISDPLLLKMGIKHIWGGEWRLKEYSNNIKLRLISPNYVNINLSYLLFMFILIFILAFITFYKNYRKKTLHL